MTIAEWVVALMWVGVTLYAVLAGADFGGGFWDLLAGGPRAGAGRRALVEHAIGPVWEANHVWLIFVLVMLWTAFPPAFAAIMSTLYIPLTAAAIGIILRGAAFAFRKTVTEVPLQRAYGAAFAASSVITPFFLGTVAGGVASGRVSVDGPTDVIGSWVNPTSMLGGVLAVTVCAYLAAVYLTADAEARGRSDLTAWFRNRALASAVAAGIVALAGIGVLAADAPTLFDGLTGRAAPLVAASAVGGVASMVLVVRGRYELARYAAILAVVAVVWGWAVGQYPYLLEDTLTIAEGAGSREMLVAMLWALGIGSLFFAPALVALLVMAKRGTLEQASPLERLEGSVERGPTG
ncbi:MAG TPA: cytochrome d ubiquinol oxidase subunit II [Acidimicrobiia bacterium]|nr:cytochrome d ubiquinol oxidase subunit II [Acidimicrobiia bacterium]